MGNSIKNAIDRKADVSTEAYTHFMNDFMKVFYDEGRFVSAYRIAEMWGIHDEAEIFLNEKAKSIKAMGLPEIL